MKLLLINPSKYDEKGNLMKFKYGAIPPTNLLLISSLIKDYKQVQVKIVDEFIDDIPFHEKFDLVGITTLFTSNFPRVIDISNQFRKRKIPVVLGGAHATCNYHECKKYADSIVVGEAENSFQHLIDDLLTKNKLKKIYKNDSLIDLENMPTIIPDYDLIDLNRYYKIGIIKRSTQFQIETSRGCPMKCMFCTVKITHGPIPRFKRIKSVIEEIRFLKQKYNTAFFSFSDDNFLFNYQRSKALLQEISKENIKFICEISTRIIDKPNLIPLLKKAGCVSALIGIESINPDNLKLIKKTHNKVKEYKELFYLFQKNNIPVCPGIIIGFDYDNIEVFSEIFNFLKNVNVQRAVFSILTPFPGTELYENLSKAKRIINNNLSLYDLCHVVFNPARLKIDQLQKEYWKLYKKYYSIKEIFYRLFKNKIKNFLYSIIVNFRFRNLVYNNKFPYNSGIRRLN